MSVGIDVRRKRSQVAVIDQVGKVLVNRNVPNGVKPVLSVIGGLPAGTPAAYEAAFGWGWLPELLEDYGFGPRMARPLQRNRIHAVAADHGYDRSARAFGVEPRWKAPSHPDAGSAGWPVLAAAVVR